MFQILVYLYDYVHLSNNIELCCTFLFTSVSYCEIFIVFCASVAVSFLIIHKKVTSG